MQIHCFHNENSPGCRDYSGEKQTREKHQCDQKNMMPHTRKIRNNEIKKVFYIPNAFFPHQRVRSGKTSHKYSEYLTVVYITHR